ncbi:iron ABC transporter ATP-binding protein FetA [Enterobacteriaceae bacterium G50]|nr:iron ABC transporter ATP-binding protein FetA [Enterobacteriaceae bacterium G50]
MMESNTILQLTGVGYRIGERQVLNDINFSIAPGEFKLITGPSGCGKSTLLKIIASLLSPSEGTIQFKGQDYTTLSPEQYRQQVSYCAQTPALFGETVYDNLIFPWQIRDKRTEPKTFQAFLTQFGLPEETLSKSINDLSGGEKQRISLIRNLQFLPDVLLLDEITSALDEENKHNVNDIIHRYVRDKNIAVLWVTHDKDEIEHADDVITLPLSGKDMQEAAHE